jgi:hypothetical protein
MKKIKNPKINPDWHAMIWHMSFYGGDIPIIGKLIKKYNLYEEGNENTKRTG